MRYSAVFLVILAAVVLAGCSGPSSQTGQQSQEPEESSTIGTTAEETSSESTAAARKSTPETTRAETVAAPVEPPPEETPAVPQKEVVEEAPLTPQKEVAEAPSKSEQAVSCDGFGSDFGAQQFFYSATPDQKATLDPEGDGFACSVGNPAASSAAPKESPAKKESSYRPPSPEEARARVEEDRRAIEAIGDQGEDTTPPTSTPDEEEAPQERRVRQSECFRLYEATLPPDERRQEAERIQAEADAQGVTLGDLVGC